MTDMFDMAIQGGRKIMCQSRGRPAIIFSVGAAIGLMIAARGIYQRGRRLTGNPETKVPKKP